MELTRAEKHVHNFMMDTQLTKRVSYTSDIKPTEFFKTIELWRPNYLRFNIFLFASWFILVKKCSGQCVKGDLVNLQKHKTCEASEFIKGQDSPTQVPTRYIRVSINQLYFIFIKIMPFLKKFFTFFLIETWYLHKICFNFINGSSKLLVYGIWNYKVNNEFEKSSFLQNTFDLNEMKFELKVFASWQRTAFISTVRLMVV